MSNSLIHDNCGKLSDNKINAKINTMASQDETDSRTSIDINVEIYEQRFSRIKKICLDLKHNYQKISDKINRSAVSWIQTNCWVKGFDLETTLLSVILYYAYSAKQPVDKQKLELILSTCIFVVKKYCNRPPIAVDQALAMVSKNYSKASLLQIEIELFQMMEYNYHFEHSVHLLVQKRLSKQQQQKSKLLIEILLLKDCEVLHNVKTLEQIVRVVKNKKKQSNSLGISSLLASKQAIILINKYRTSFDSDSFVVNL